MDHDYQHILKTLRPNIQKSTLKNYLSAIKRISSLPRNKPLLEELKNYENTINNLKDYVDNLASRKTLLAVILVLTDYWRKIEQDTKAYFLMNKAYNRELVNLRNQVDTYQKTKQKNIKEDTNWVNWDQLLSIIPKLKKKHKKEK